MTAIVTAYVVGFVLTAIYTASIAAAWVDYKKEPWEPIEWGTSALLIAAIWPLSTLLLLGNHMGKKAIASRLAKKRDEAEINRLLKESGL